jgi:hypothetical protein
MPKSRVAMVLLFVAALDGCATKAPTPQDELDRKFAEMMNGVTLVGGPRAGGTIRSRTASST